MILCFSTPVFVMTVPDSFYCLQVTYDFTLLQGMPDIGKDDPKKYLDSLHVSCCSEYFIYCDLFSST